MSRRVSSRLAAQQATNSIFNKENNPKQLSPPLAATVPLQEKATTKKAVPETSKLTPKGKPTTKVMHVTPTITSKHASVAKGRAISTKTVDNVKRDEATPSSGNARKRKRPMPITENEKGDDDDELPHNMGRRIQSKPNAKKIESKAVPLIQKEPKRRPKAVKQEEVTTDAKEILHDAHEPPKKRARKAHHYGLTPGETPFPDWPHPTTEECHIVHDLLMDTIPAERRKRFVLPDDIPPPSEVVAGCGEVPSILDALIRTLLSAATNGQNSSNAFQGLVKRFGLATDGVGKGSVNWNAVHKASDDDVFDAIKCGGLAKNKTANIKKLLSMVHQENQDRLAILLKAKEAGELENADEEEKAETELELRALQKGILTLDYYHHLEKNEAISTFTNYPGIGVKTAACVNLFCMQRPCFAVDTHVFRLCQYLGWVPPEDSRVEKQKKVDRNTTFSHCEVRVPDELKYGLHQLFLEHGKKCPRCRAVTGEKSEGWADANCVIEHLVKRLGAKKGGVDSPKKASKGNKSQRKEISEEEDSDLDVSENGITEAKIPTPKKATTRNRKVDKAPTPKAAAAKPAKAKGSRKTKGSMPKNNGLPGNGVKRKNENGNVQTEDSEISDLTDVSDSSANEENQS